MDWTGWKGGQSIDECRRHFHVTADAETAVVGITWRLTVLAAEMQVGDDVDAPLDRHEASLL
jgi:hypothetical protein